MWFLPLLAKAAAAAVKVGGIAAKAIGTVGKLATPLAKAVTGVGKVAKPIAGIAETAGTGATAGQGMAASLLGNTATTAAAQTAGQGMASSLLGSGATSAINPIGATATQAATAPSLLSKAGTFAKDALVKEFGNPMKDPIGTAKKMGAMNQQSQSQGGPDPDTAVFSSPQGMGSSETALPLKLSAMVANGEMSPEELMAIRQRMRQNYG